MNSFVEKIPPSSLPLAKGEEPKAEGVVENKLVLSSFEYTDPDGDGIYTADVVSPVVPGEYEIITVIDYIDPVLGTRQMRMITVIDPEGYVFEKIYVNGASEEFFIKGITDLVIDIVCSGTQQMKFCLFASAAYKSQRPRAFLFLQISRVPYQLPQFHPKSDIIQPYPSRQNA